MQLHHGLEAFPRRSNSQAQGGKQSHVKLPRPENVSGSTSRSGNGSYGPSAKPSPTLFHDVKFQEGLIFHHKQILRKTPRMKTLKKKFYTTCNFCKSTLGRHRSLNGARMARSRRQSQCSHFVKSLHQHTIQSVMTRHRHLGRLVGGAPPHRHGKQIPTQRYHTFLKPPRGQEHMPQL